MSTSLDKLRMTVARRAEADTILSTAWCALPLVGAIISFVIVLWAFAAYGGPYGGLYGPTVSGAFYLAVIAASLIPAILMLYLLYMLIKRRNTHFRRTHDLFADIVATLRELSAEKGVDITGQLGLVERYLSEARMEEVERSPILWVVLCIIPIVNIFAVLYVLYFLMRDWYRHERREDDMWMQVNSALTALGYRPIDTRRPEPIPHRSFFVYLILYFVIPLIWAIYWLYTLIKDPNNHMASQARIEDDLLLVLGTAPTAPPTPPTVS
mgnify:CR=1 FL=1